MVSRVSRSWLGTSPRLTTLLFIALLPLSCASHISAPDLLALIESDAAPPIVDVRTQGEFESGHVPGAVHVSFWSMWSLRSTIPMAPGDPVVVYCEHGPRAGIARAILWTLGVYPVSYLEGHMSGWRRQGLPIQPS